jgi:hypothetical protein
MPKPIRSPPSPASSSNSVSPPDPSELIVGSPGASLTLLRGLGILAFAQAAALSCDVEPVPPPGDVESEELFIVGLMLGLGERARFCFGWRKSRRDEVRRIGRRRGARRRRLLLKRSR